jgi:4-amino-4-deoxy-L-arabinose transferase-like glycosyltransferase
MKQQPNPLAASMFSLTQTGSFVRSANREKAFVRNLGVLAPIVLLQLSLAWYRIDYQSFWTDEVASLAAAAPGESFFSSTIWKNGQGPLYFALLHIWMMVGDTQFVIRSLAALLGAVAVCLTYAFGLRFSDRRFATISAMLMATSPFLIWYSQETRYITLAIATSLLSMYSFQRALATDFFSAWAFYAIATTAALFSFVPLAFLTVAQGFYLLLNERRLKLPKWIAWQFGVSLIFGTWLLISYGGLSIGARPDGSSLAVAVNPVPLETGTPKQTTFDTIPYTFFAFSSGFSMGPSVEELHITRDLPTVLKYFPTVAPLGLFFGALFSFGIAQAWRQSLLGLLLPWLIIPIMGVLAISAVTDVAYNVRYVSAALPAYILLLAVGITNLRHRTLQLSVLLAVLSVNGVSLAQYYFNPRYAKADARGAARFLESVGDRRDVILLVGSGTAWGYYYKGDLPVVSWGQSVNDNRETLSSKVQELSKRYDRLWFLSIRPWETDPNGNVKAALDHSLNKDHDLALPGVAISSYARGKFGE